jgi:phosphohistidine phosphatase
MNLYIVRHAHADNGYPDSERRLRDYGRNKLLDALPHWKEFIPKVDVILTSPYKRALETAEIIHSNYSVEEKLIVDKSLQPGMNIHDVLITLQALGKEHMMLVGHMPDVADLVTSLTPKLSFEFPFSPASLAAIEFNGEIKPKSGKLKFLLPSEN